jgi:hypothetical protein
MAAIEALQLTVGDTVIERQTFTMPNGQILESEKEVLSYSSDGMGQLSYGIIITT